VNLHDLQPSEGSRRRKKRVGRGHGSGRVKTSGRGTKGQNARTGGGWNPRFEGGQTPIHRRLPYRRGFRNPFRVSYEVINIADLAGFEAGSIIDRSALERAGLLRKDDVRPVKLLSKGESAIALQFDGVHVSRVARRKIEAAGGSFAGVELAPLDEEPAAEPSSGEE
jgi:large subunit ribosomal protein L15